jgi:hypothetical protein
VNARVLVFCPDARRRDGLVEMIARERNALAEKFWLAECLSLERGDMKATVWRRATDDVLHPLVS